MNKEEVFLNLLKENMIHLRHQETERMWIANIFVAIVVGTIAYFIKSDKTVSWFLPFVLLMISILCLCITLKLNKVVSEIQESVKNIFHDKQLLLEEGTK